MTESASQTRVTYTIDTRVSRLTIKVTAAGMLSAFGHDPVFAARGFAGDLEFVPGTLEDASLRVRLGAATLSAEGGINEKDRREIERGMHEEVLETAKYPEITFETTRVSASTVSPGIFKVDVTGRLTLHGVTRELAFPAHVTVNGPMLRAHGTFSIRQTDFGITLVSVAGGALKVKDELQCPFDIVARQS